MQPHRVIRRKMNNFFQKHRAVVFIIFTIALLIILFLIISQFLPKKSPEIIDSYTESVSTTTPNNDQESISADQNILDNLPYFIPNSFDVYATHDDNGNIIIRADLIGCTDYQTEPLEEQVIEYLKSKNIQYPVQFTYCN